MGNLRKLTTLYLSILLIIFTLLPLEAANAGIFDPSHSDKSLEYLEMIFGNKVGNINLGVATHSNQFLGNLFQIFNSIILAVVIFILSYVSAISTINTAQEGQVMGKKWSSVWIPLRSAVGLLLLAPVPGSGYSSLQVVIMWVVLNGVGAADKMWDFVLNNLSQGISATQKAEINREDVTTLSQQGTILAKDLFNSLVCLEIIKKNLPQGQNFDLKANFNQQPILPTATTLTMSKLVKFGFDDPANPARQNICGEMQITASLTDNDLVDQNNLTTNLLPANKMNIVTTAYNIKEQSVQRMIKAITPVAHEIATSIKNPDGSIILPDVIEHPSILYNKAIKEYQQSMSHLNKQTAMSWEGIRTKTDRQSISDTIIRQGKDFGWITAGSYYYLLSQGSLKNLLATAKEQLTVKEQFFHGKEIKEIDKLNTATFGVTSTQIQPYIDALADKRQAISNLFNPPTELAISDRLRKLPGDRLHQLPSDTEESIQTILPDINRLLQDTGNSAMAPYIEQFLTLNETILKDIQHRLSDEHDDPLLSQAMFGVKLMQLSETFWVSIIMGSFVSNDIANQFASGNFLSIIVGLLPVILVFGGMIWTIGATLAIYTPMVPYMIFVVTALSWFTLVIETIVAGPIIVLGFVIPSQDELGKIAPALGIIANVFLRPVLMVIGLIMAAKLYNAIISMVNMGFKFSFAALQSQTGTSMFAWVVMLILYTGFIVTLVNKCCAIIYQLPDKTLRYAGITSEQTDVSSVKETQQHFDQSAKQGMAPIEGVATGAASKIKGQVEAAEAAKRDEQQAQQNQDPSGLRRH